MEKLNPSLESLIHRAGFSSTFEHQRLCNLVWLTAQDLAKFVTPEQYTQIQAYLMMPQRLRD
jgi:hypothetical protein